jgi:single-stranded DNA-binding protein
MILNWTIQAGNLVDKPTISVTAGKRYVRARLAQDWTFHSHGQKKKQQQFLPLYFVEGSDQIAETYEKGDNIVVAGQLIRRVVSGSRDTTVVEIHVVHTFRIAGMRAGTAEAEDIERIRLATGLAHVPLLVGEKYEDNWPTL